MTVVEAASYSIDILKVLGNSSNVGSVHSTFKKSLNLKFRDRLINISDNYIVKPPFGVQLEVWVVEYLINNLMDDDCILWDSENKDIVFTRMNLRIGLNKNFYYPQAVPMKINYSNLSDNLSALVTFATKARFQNGFDKDMSEITAFINDDDQVIDDEFYNQLRLLKNSLLEGNLSKDILNYWVGRGKGLTPSGDDFMAGVLAFLSTAGIESNNFEGFKKYLLSVGCERTTQIGFEYLWYAVQGKYSVNIINLCKLMMKEDKKEFEKALWNLSLSGHTSGVDTILGIVLSTSLVLTKRMAWASKAIEVEE